MDLNWEAVLPKDLSKYNIPEDYVSWQKACCIGYYSKYKRNLEIEVKYLADYKIFGLLLAALGACFEELYNYPEGSIRSVEDYCEIQMFFLNVQWPPKEYNQIIAELTQEKFLAQINKFICKLVNDAEDHIYREKLYLCEETVG